MDKNYSGVYKIENMINGKVYIGSSINIKSRWAKHKMMLKRGEHDNTHLQTAYNLYGEENFSFEIIDLVKEKEDLLPLEQYYLDLYNSFNNKFGYNILPLSHSSLGYKHTPESRAKMKLGRSKLPKKPKAPKNPRYEGDGKPKLKDNEVQEIIQLIINGESSLSICKRYDVHQITIDRIKYGEYWTHLTGGAIKGAKKKPQLSEYDVSEIRRLKNDNPKLSNEKIGKMFNTSGSTVHRIIKYKIWKDVGANNG